MGKTLSFPTSLIKALHAIRVGKLPFMDPDKASCLRKISSPRYPSILDARNLVISVPIGFGDRFGNRPRGYLTDL